MASIVAGLITNGTRPSSTPGWPLASFRQTLYNRPVAGLVVSYVASSQQITSLMDRSSVMKAVRSTDTQLEVMVRRRIHGMGYRYRLHRTDLPGTPDLVFPARRKIIFIHGCFWHQHDCRQGNRLPKSRKGYWEPKLRRNVERDAENQKALVKLGWEVMIVWECETRECHHEELGRKIRLFLEKTEQRQIARIDS